MMKGDGGGAVLLIGKAVKFIKLKIEIETLSTPSHFL